MEEEIRSEFSVHLLNDDGVAKAKALGLLFTKCLNGVEVLCGLGGRDLALVRTKLQEASFFAKRAMALLPENQKATE